MVGPPRTVYHRWLGWHAPDLRRLVTAAAVGLIVAAAIWQFVSWQVAVLSGWDAAALTFLVTVWAIIVRIDGPRTEHLVLREDLGRDTARLLLLAASGASLVAVVFALHLAGPSSGAQRVLLITVATLTVVISWTVVNTVFTLRYAHQYYSSPHEGVDFGGAPATAQPDYRDFAYLAFTIGMTYQVSDTSLRDRRIRRTVLFHALLSYVFGVVIVAAGVNIVAGLVA
jgi:uncharacterized membrane protein